MALASGTHLGPYEILGAIGAGGMGEVYRARDIRLDRTVAIKVLKKERGSDPGRLRRFAQEARSASALNHPNIITIYDIGKHRGTPYIAMEYVEGKTLRDVLSEWPLPTKTFLHLAGQTAEGLAKAHAAGIVHRDLKPENIMVTSDGYVKILDFGLAKFASESAAVEQHTTTLAKAETREGVVLGTLAYMSPEQAAGRPVDYRSDQFALGSILYEMATGKLPFKRNTTAQTQVAIITEDPEPIPSGTLPDHFPTIIARCLAKNPGERYDSTGDLARELKILGDEQSRRWFKATGEKKARKALDSIAVLPLVNLRAEPGQDFFADGMTEALITDLAKIGALKVISRTSAMRYKGTDKPLPQIARELRVDAVLEGSVLRVGERIRITAQLIDATSDQHLWAESYERDLGDVLRLQSDVARAIAREIQVKLTPQEAALLAGARQVDPVAHDSYLRGRQCLNTWRLGQAAEHFEQAIEKDSHHALAYSGLADSLVVGSFWGNIPPRQVCPQAREAATRAIAIDSTLGEAHALLASIHMFYDWNWEAAELEIKQALELAPGSSYSRVCYSWYLNLKRRHDEAIVQARTAQELDPFSSFSNTGLGHRLWQARRYDDAIAEFKKWLAIEPDDWYAHLHLGIVYQEKLMIEEAISEIERGVELSSGAAMAFAVAFMIHFRFGSKDLAEHFAGRLKAKAEREYIPPTSLAYVHLARGEADQAFEWASKASAERDPFLVWLRVSPFDSMQFPRDPRLEDLLDRAGLP